MRATRVELDAEALRHNLQQVRKAAPHSRVMAAIKANAYGHGLQRSARILSEAGVDALGVASLDEALQLRTANIKTPITLLEGFFDSAELPLIEEHRLDVVLHHEAQVQTLEALEHTPTCGIWLKVDTGMHRLGVSPEQAPALWQRLQALLPAAQLRGMMTHLANADDRMDNTTPTQLAAFAQATAGLTTEQSIANSAGILAWPDSHADWVRPGIMLYGVDPFVDGAPCPATLQPVMTLRSELIAIKPLHKGDRIGYGGTWTCPEDMPVGVVAVGYGDGYPRHAPNGTPVLIGQQRVPMVGRVSMDMITVDLRNCPEARVGDEVTLWGRGLPVEEIATHAGTIAYELLCGITARVRGQ